MLPRIALSVLLLSSAGALAAPLDALLTANQPVRPHEFIAEIGLDAMNSTLDVFDVRGKDPVYAGTTVGDYSGWHARARYAPADSLTLQGGYWKRKLTHRQDDELIDSWQAAVQYRLYGHENSRAHGAIRLGAWGDRSGVLSKTSPTLFMEKTLNSVSVDSPKDHQTQIDAIGTWILAEQTELSVFAGAGSSRVTTGNMTANYTRSSGCNYNLTFTASGTSGQLVQGTCPPDLGLVVTSFTTSESVLQEFSYRSTYYQSGGMLQRQTPTWSLRGGYQFQHWNRADVDALIASRGGVAYRTNHILVAEVARKIDRQVAVFARGQLMSNQLVGEIPFSYNSVTASKFGRRYGIASFGVTMAF